MSRLVSSYHKPCTKCKMLLSSAAMKTFGEVRHVCKYLEKEGDANMHAEELQNDDQVETVTLPIGYGRWTNVEKFLRDLDRAFFKAISMCVPGKTLSLRFLTASDEPWGGPHSIDILLSGRPDPHQAFKSRALTAYQSMISQYAVLGFSVEETMLTRVGLPSRLEISIDPPGQQLSLFKNV